MVNLARNRAIPTSFETERLFVRRYVIADARNLYTAARESINEVYPFLPWCHPNYDIEDARFWIRAVEPDWKDGNTYSFAIYDRNDRTRLLGGCGVSRYDEHPVVNLGYWIRTSETGNGVATEATIGLATFAFNHLDIARTEIVMSIRNDASRRVAERSGATFEGRLANRLRIHGKLHDAFMYSLTPGQPSSGVTAHSANGRNP